MVQRKTTKSPIRILAPSYHGQHTYNKYEKMRKEISVFVKEEGKLNVDFLYEEEIFNYFYDLFFPIYTEVSHRNSIKIESKYKKRLRSIRKIATQFMIIIKPIKMEKKKFVMEIYI